MVTDRRCRRPAPAEDGPRPASDPNTASSTIKDDRQGQRSASAMSCLVASRPLRPARLAHRKPDLAVGHLARLVAGDADLLAQLPGDVDGAGVVEIRAPATPPRRSGCGPAWRGRGISVAVRHRPPAERVGHSGSSAYVASGRGAATSASRGSLAGKWSSSWYWTFSDCEPAPRTATGECSRTGSECQPHGRNQGGGPNTSQRALRRLLLRRIMNCWMAVSPHFCTEAVPEAYRDLSPPWPRGHELARSRGSLVESR